MFAGPGIGMWWAGMYLMSRLLTIMIIALIIALFVRLLTRRRHWRGYYGFPPPPPGFGPTPAGPGPRHFGPFPQQPSAMEILRQRYARGEIDAATFDQMRERLEASERPRQEPS